VCVEFYTHLPAYENGTDSVLKLWHIKFRHRGITQKKAYNSKNLFISYTEKIKQEIVLKKI